MLPAVALLLKALGDISDEGKKINPEFRSNMGRFGAKQRFSQGHDAPHGSQDVIMARLLLESTLPSSPIHDRHLEISDSLSLRTVSSRTWVMAFACSLETEHIL